MLLPPGGTHMPTLAPSVAAVLGEKSTTGMPSTSRNVATAASKSRTAMAMRGMAVITGTSSTGMGCDERYAVAMGTVVPVARIDRVVVVARGLRR